MVGSDSSVIIVTSYSDCFAIFVIVNIVSNIDFFFIII